MSGVGLKIGRIVLAIVGICLVMGAAIALVSPGKDPKDPKKTKPRDWPVILGLLFGGIMCLYIARSMAQQG